MRLTASHSLALWLQKLHGDAIGRLSWTNRLDVIANALSNTTGRYYYHVIILSQKVVVQFIVYHCFPVEGRVWATEPLHTYPEASEYLFPAREIHKSKREDVKLLFSHGSNLSGVLNYRSQEQLKGFL